MVRDSAGNLYGATSSGGASTNPNCFAGTNQLPFDGCGEVFKLDASGKFSVFYSFSGKTACWDGCEPLAPLTLDPAGNLYGATYLGGSRNCNIFKLNNVGGFENTECGVVFKLDRTGKETVLHRFGNAQKDGDFPNPGMILDASGNLYGTTAGGGINTNGGNAGAGVVFKLDAAGNETVLHYFQEFVDGWSPQAGVIQDAAGNFYGMTNSNGLYPADGGTIFKLDPAGNLTQLYGFEGNANPTDPLLLDPSGNLYGTTLFGGDYQLTCGFFGDPYGCGTVFKLDSSGNLTTLYSFTGGTDGDSPYAGLIMDAAGNLYGTAAYGGTVNSACPAGCGVVFEIKP